MKMTLTLGIEDLDRTEVFYRDILEMPIERLVPSDKFAPILLLRRGDATLLFRQMESLEASHPLIFQNLNRHPRGVGMTLEFTLADLPPVVRNIERNELHTLYELEDDEFGRREVWLHDPDGYLLVLCQETEN